ncbi:hypothetical protein PAECIP111893_00759 [Paenibacillus plantiphilus]|uniref:Uncharacterized protein n=1 Tax=Paenibacillus plantiphilus TaxID=2905650 RepID=A0ABN8G034_9BACL|nr:hypothetical protein [Paenibacillus plantiphilus]CAH1195797.1 hypothetical protein PAECIP111893_00759 [Paenibacillus plantiphilus]
MLTDNRTGQRVSVIIAPMQISDVRYMRPGWTPGFNWRQYFRMKNVEVYKICVAGSTRLEGAIALEHRGDHVWIHLIEKAPYNRGLLEQYKHVAHHLFAFATQRHLDHNGDGFVAFEIKTGLANHYIREYGAVPMSGSRMFIPDVAGLRLIEVYLT